MKLNGKTDIGKGRAENQDTFRSGLAAGVAFGVVCDGMGGAQHGKLASSLAAENLEETLLRQLENEPRATAEELLASAIGSANMAVYAKSGKGEIVMGTTVVCALACAGVMHIAHVGDSRAYLYQNGHLRQLTHDHSMVQEMVDNGTLSPAEAACHPERNVITRALGVEDNVQPSFVRETITQDSLYLLCSDGLSNMVDEAQMAQLMESTDFWNLAQALVQAALDAGGDDNITVLLMRPEEADTGSR